VNLEKDFQSFEFKSTCLNYQLSYQSTQRKHLLLESSLSSHKDVIVNYVHILTHDSYTSDRLNRIT